MKNKETKESRKRGQSRRRWIEILAAMSAAAGVLAVISIAGASSPSMRAEALAAAQQTYLGNWGPLMEGPNNDPVWPNEQFVHAAHLPTGYIVLWSGLNGWTSSGSPGYCDLYVWDAHNHEFYEDNDPDWRVPANIFCSGHSLTSDGHLNICGGTAENSSHNGIADAFLFNKSTLQWSQLADMNAERWYPTVSRLADGQMMAYSGWKHEDPNEPGDPNFGDYDDRPELYTGTGWDAISPTPLIDPQYYPFMFTIHHPVETSERAVFYVGKRLRSTTHGPARTSWILRPDASGGPMWTQIPPGQSVKNIVGSGAVLWIDGTATAKRGKIYALGGRVPGGHVSTDLIDLLDMDATANPLTWQWNIVDTDPFTSGNQGMSLPRQECDIVILPTGDFFIVGGGRERSTGPMMNGEIFSPWTNTILGVTDNMADHRMYHSISILLPDGSVLNAGGEDVQFNRNRNAQIYYPPYFYASRPAITGVGSNLDYNGTHRMSWSQGVISTPFDAQKLKVTMVGLGSVTHGFDSNQRFINLSFSETPTEDSAVVYTPKNGGIAPPGYYMLFVVYDGVPSYGKYVKID